MQRTLFEPVHEDFRASVREFLRREVSPHYEQWEADGIVPRELYTTAGRQGFVGMMVPEQYGGAGIDDFRFNCVLIEECMRIGAASVSMGLSLQNELCIPYLLEHGTDEQKRRWLPPLVAGDELFALALTEPGAGSDLAAIAAGARPVEDGYLVDGTKTFISGGLHARRVIAAVKTDRQAGHRGVSLVVLDSDADGFERGRKLAKIGLHAQDTAELFFTDLHVPTGDLLGAEGRGFAMMMHNLPMERLSIAHLAVAGARAALDWTLEYVTGRTAFGQPIGTFQNSRFALAEIATEVDIAQAFVDHCTLALNAGRLTPEDAAKAKWWCTELQGRVVDRCLQLHGGYGYMTEYPIARAFVDARVTRIYGGTNEIMKEIIARSMGLRPPTSAAG